MQPVSVPPRERYSAGKPELLRLLADISATGEWESAYLAPDSVTSPHKSPAIRSASPVLRLELHEIAAQVRGSDTGLAVFLGADRVVAVIPPFPIHDEGLSEGAETAQLARLLNRDLTVGVILLRLGRYAVGVMRREEVVASKAGTRYVKSRHRAGGSSQRRFERSRERLRRELFDAACKMASEVFSPFLQRMDYLLMGGERHTLKGFAQRCSTAQRLAPITLQRTLEVDRPNRKALDRMPHEVWKSRVLVFGRGEG